MNLLPHEIHIGDWIEKDGEAYQAVAATLVMLERGENNISPIPLTGEWHDRFGIKESGFHSFVYQIEKTKQVVFCGDYVYIRDIYSLDGVENHDDDLCTLWNNDKRKRSMYVHEWQYLYFFFTGKQLEIKKESISA